MLKAVRDIIFERIQGLIFLAIDLPAVAIDPSADSATLNIFAVPPHHLLKAVRFGHGKPVLFVSWILRIQLLN